MEEDLAYELEELEREMETLTQRRDEIQSRIQQNGLRRLEQIKSEIQALEQQAQSLYKLNNMAYYQMEFMRQCVSPGDAYWDPYGWQGSSYSC